MRICRLVASVTGLVFVKRDGRLAAEMDGTRVVDQLRRAVRAFHSTREHKESVVCDYHPRFSSPWRGRIELRSGQRQSAESEKAVASLYSAR